MKLRIGASVLAAVGASWLATALPATAQTSTAVSAPTGQKTLAATINVYVFPTAGQDASRQSKDEAQCYSWATQNTGSDPFQLAKQAEQIQAQGAAAQQQVAQSGKGAGAKAAVGGAAVGALIGEIADDKGGEGAAIGAGVGLLAARRQTRRAKSQASAQVEAQTSAKVAATEEQVVNFKKAFAVCLEAQKYMVRF